MDINLNILGIILIAIMFVALAFISGYSAGVINARQNTLIVLRQYKHLFIREWLAIYGEDEDKDQAFTAAVKDTDKVIKFQTEPKDVKMVLNR